MFHFEKARQPAQALSLAGVELDDLYSQLGRAHALNGLSEQALASYDQLSK